MQSARIEQRACVVTTAKVEGEETRFGFLHLLWTESVPLDWGVCRIAIPFVRLTWEVCTYDTTTIEAGRRS